MKVRKDLSFPPDFVIHSLRHTMLTRLGEAGVDAFTVMRIAGDSTLSVSQRYVHPTPETLERAIGRLDSQVEAGEAEKRQALATSSATVDVRQQIVLQ